MSEVVGYVLTAAQNCDEQATDLLNLLGISEASMVYGQSVFYFKCASSVNIYGKGIDYRLGIRKLDIIYGNWGKVRIDQSTIVIAGHRLKTAELLTY